MNIVVIIIELDDLVVNQSCGSTRQEVYGQAKRDWDVHLSR